MIGKNVTLYCCEDISLIENYEAAINDETQTWHCHHRFEIDLGLSMKELNDRNLYYNRPASELIFITKAEHHRLHNQGKNNPKNRKNPEAYMSETTIKERRKKLSLNATFRGTHPTWMNNGITRVRPKTQKEIERYRNLGYHIGFKLK